MRSKGFATTRYNGRQLPGATTGYTPEKRRGLSYEYLILYQMELEVGYYAYRNI